MPHLSAADRGPFDAHDQDDESADLIAEACRRSLQMRLSAHHERAVRKLLDAVAAPVR